MLRAVSQKSRPARVAHRIPSGKLGQSQIQIRTKASELLRLCQKCVLDRAPAAVARRLACPRCLPLADAEFFGAGGILIWRNQHGLASNRSPVLTAALPARDLPPC